jgi:hypothetical protein
LDNERSFILDPALKIDIIRMADLLVVEHDMLSVDGNGLRQHFFGQKNMKLAVGSWGSDSQMNSVFFVSDGITDLSTGVLVTGSNFSLVDT